MKTFSSAMSGKDIEHFMKTNHIHEFQGVFTADTVPVYPVHLPACYIFNTDAVYGEGIHWVGVIVDQNACYYFDSYGVNGLGNVERWLRTFHKPIYTNSTQIQSLNTSTCGQFCCLFILDFIHGKSFTDILYAWDIQPTPRNESLCVRRFRHYMTRHHRNRRHH